MRYKSNVKFTALSLLLLSLTASMRQPISSPVAASLQGDTIAAIPIQTAEPPKLLGVIPQGWITSDVIQDELVALDNWTGKHTTIAGLPSDFEDPNRIYIPTQLNLLWNAGYTPYINLGIGYFSSASAYAIASGIYDAAITAWAQYYASWATSGKWAFIALLPEMNVPWTTYGMDPVNYRMAYARVQQIFAQAGVSSSSVRWVFSANSWVQIPYENYYPGDSLIDVVGFMALNHGFCPDSLHPSWTTDSNWNLQDVVYGFALRELRVMAPGKPIFVTQTATSAYIGLNQVNSEAKNQWLRDSYAYLARQQDVKAVLYYNFTQSSFDCDWEVFKVGSSQYTGYRDAVSAQRYGYLTPDELGRVDWSQRPSTLNAYLPVLTKKAANIQASPIVFGTYPQVWPGLQSTMDNEFHALDAWSGKHASLVGVFVDLIQSDPIYGIQQQLEVIWDNGYTPFVNLTTTTSGVTAKKIAEGGIDSYLHALGRSFAIYATSGNQKAFIAPLDEMNGDWLPYGVDPANAALAFQRIQQIFAQEGVPADSVAWVFAPAGTSPPGEWPVEAYYPGDANVDFVAISSYHLGYCTYFDPSFWKWTTPDDLPGRDLRGIAELFPNKPILIAQTATSSNTSKGVYNDAAKSQWLYDAYTYFASFPNLRGILYYNRWDAECDWALFQKDVKGYDGYRQALTNPKYVSVAPSMLLSLDYWNP